MLLLGIVVFVSTLEEAQATPAPAWSAVGTGPDSQLGHSVTSAGDVNGDGYDDVVVGAGVSVDLEGAAVVFHGSASGLGGTPAWSATGSAAGNWFGFNPRGVGDVNGDGYDDVVIGEHNYTNGEEEEGAAHLYLGGPSGLGPVPSWSYEGNQVDGAFGIGIAGGDVNGDGFADVVVGGCVMSGAVAQEGLVHLFLGGPLGLAAVPSWVVGSGQSWAGFGCSLDAADVNGDGFADVVASASGYTYDQLQEGIVAIYFGAAAGPASSPSVVLQGNQTGSGFGIVSSAGDVNSDGFEDILVGAPAWSGGEQMEGRVSLYLGSAAGPAAAPSWTAESNWPFQRFGHVVSGAGDVNGDGYDDVVLGEEEDGRPCGLGISLCGSVTLLYGGPTGLLTYALTSFGSEYLELYGSDAASAGDVNGDGLSDVIVGARGRSGVGDFSGAAYVYHGR